MTGDELLDLAQRQRIETVRFDLLDSANVTIASNVAVVADEPPQVTNDVNRSIRRQLSNMRISSADANAINTVTERIRPWWVLGAGGAGFEYSLGIFLFGDASRLPRTSGTDTEATLFDQCLILDQKLTQSVGYSAGKNIGAALTEQAAAAGIVSTAIDATTYTVAASIAWAAGRDTRLSVMTDLCAMAGFLPPYFDNDGVLVCRSAPNLATAVPTVTPYGPGTRVYDESVVLSDDLLVAPNRYVVIDTSATNAPIVGTFDVPASAPHSFANRGFYVTETIEIQGLTDPTAAAAAAAAAYGQRSATFTWLAFDGSPDPRHDTHDILEFDGVNYREQAWSLPCTAGARHGHDCRGIYT